MTELERLLALEAIMLLKAGRDRALDTKNWDALRALHAPDHRSHNDGHEDWNSAEQMIANLRRSLPEGVRTVHHAHTPDISFESATRASGIWGVEHAMFWMQGDREHWRQGFGFYHERYEKRDGRWLFTFRQLKRTHVRNSAGAVWPPAAVATS